METLNLETLSKMRTSQIMKPSSSLRREPKRKLASASAATLTKTLSNELSTSSAFSKDGTISADLSHLNEQPEAEINGSPSKRLRQSPVSIPHNSGEFSTSEPKSPFKSIETTSPKVTFSARNDTNEMSRSDLSLDSQKETTLEQLQSTVERILSTPKRQKRRKIETIPAGPEFPSCPPWNTNTFMNY